jgi:hypothetical protein
MPLHHVIVARANKLNIQTSAYVSEGINYTDAGLWDTEACVAETQRKIIASGNLQRCCTGIQAIPLGEVRVRLDRMAAGN